MFLGWDGDIACVVEIGGWGYGCDMVMIMGKLDYSFLRSCAAARQ